MLFALLSTLRSFPALFRFLPKFPNTHITDKIALFSVKSRQELLPLKEAEANSRSIRAHGWPAKAEIHISSYADGPSFANTQHKETSLSIIPALHKAEACAAATAPRLLPAASSY